jgi:outer membrane protein assembly factor BamB
VKQIAVIGFVVAALPLMALADADVPDPLAQWGQWRGPLGTGVAPRGDPPLEWSEQQNIRWKTAIPGKGHASPIVWGNRVFLTTAVAHGEAEASDFRHAPGAHHNVPPSRRQKFVVLALDRRDGAVLWQRTVRDARPNDSTHETATWASHSAVTDGRHLIAFFGSHGLYGLDLDGKLLWETDLGDMRSKHGHGEGSSPALHGDTVIVNWDHEGQSFVTALDKRNGEQRWKVARDEGTSWSTPLIVEHGGKSQVIVSATKRVRAYDLASGEVIWECGGLSGNVVATPVAADGYVYVANSYETRAMLAIRLAGAKGDVTGTDAVAWTRQRDTPYVPSPVLYGDSLCFLKHYQGLLTCVQAKTGTPLFGPQRLPGIRNVYASLVGAADRLYIVDRNGTTVVIARGNEFELLASNRLDDSFSASPAVAGSELFLRGERNLYCVAEGPTE